MTSIEWTDARDRLETVRLFKRLDQLTRERFDDGPKPARKGER